MNIARIAAITAQGGALYYKYQATTTAAAQSTTPKYTFGVGAPAAVVSWGDGTANDAVVSGIELNHAYAAAGTYTVTLIANQQDTYLQQIDISADKVTGAMWAQNFSRFLVLQQFIGHTNAGLTGGFALGSIPEPLVRLDLSNTSSVITGALADLKAAMTHLNLALTSSAITGALSDLKAAMAALILAATASVITGGAVAIPAKNLDIYLYSTGMTQAQVDDVARRVWTDKETFTAAAPVLHIGGTNAAPSGIYQNAIPPTTGKERIFDLVTGTQTPAGPEWTVIYTA